MALTERAFAGASAKAPEAVAGELRTLGSTGTANESWRERLIQARAKALLDKPTVMGKVVANIRRLTDELLQQTRLNIDVDIHITKFEAAVQCEAGTSANPALTGLHSSSFKSSIASATVFDIVRRCIRSDVPSLSRLAARAETAQGPSPIIPMGSVVEDPCVKTAYPACWTAVEERLVPQLRSQCGLSSHEKAVPSASAVLKGVLRQLIEVAIQAQIPDLDNNARTNIDNYVSQELLADSCLEDIRLRFSSAAEARQGDIIRAMEELRNKFHHMLSSALRSHVALQMNSTSAAQSTASQSLTLKSVDTEAPGSTTPLHTGILVPASKDVEDTLENDSLDVTSLQNVDPCDLDCVVAALRNARKQSPLVTAVVDGYLEALRELESTIIEALLDCNAQRGVLVARYLVARQALHDMANKPDADAEVRERIHQIAQAHELPLILGKRLAAYMHGAQSQLLSLDQAVLDRARGESNSAQSPLLRGFKQSMRHIEFSRVLSLPWNLVRSAHGAPRIDEALQDTTKLLLFVDFFPHMLRNSLPKASTLCSYLVTDSSAHSKESGSPISIAIASVPLQLLMNYPTSEEYTVLNQLEVGYLVSPESTKLQRSLENLQHTLEGLRSKPVLEGNAEFLRLKRLQRDSQQSVPNIDTDDTILALTYAAADAVQQESKGGPTWDDAHDKALLQDEKDSTEDHLLRVAEAWGFVPPARAGREDILVSRPLTSQTRVLPIHSSVDTTKSATITLPHVLRSGSQDNYVLLRPQTSVVYPRSLHSETKPRTAAVAYGVTNVLSTESEKLKVLYPEFASGTKPRLEPRPQTARTPASVFRQAQESALAAVKSFQLHHQADQQRLLSRGTARQLVAIDAAAPSSVASRETFRLPQISNSQDQELSSMTDAPRLLLSNATSHAPAGPKTTTSSPRIQLMASPPPSRGEMIAQRKLAVQLGPLDGDRLSEVVRRLSREDERPSTSFPAMNSSRNPQRSVTGRKAECQKRDPGVWPDDEGYFAASGAETLKRTMLHIGGFSEAPKTHDRKRKLARSKTQRGSKPPQPSILEKRISELTSSANQGTLSADEVSVSVPEQQNVAQSDGGIPKDEHLSIHSSLISQQLAGPAAVAQAPEAVLTYLASDAVAAKKAVTAANAQRLKSLRMSAKDKQAIPPSGANPRTLLTALGFAAGTTASTTALTCLTSSQPISETSHNARQQEAEVLTLIADQYYENVLSEKAAVWVAPEWLLKGRREFLNQAKVRALSVGVPSSVSSNQKGSAVVIPQPVSSGARSILESARELCWPRPQERYFVHSRFRSAQLSSAVLEDFIERAETLSPIAHWPRFPLVLDAVVEGLVQELHESGYFTIDSVQSGDSPHTIFEKTCRRKAFDAAMLAKNWRIYLTQQALPPKTFAGSQHGNLVLLIRQLASKQLVSTLCQSASLGIESQSGPQRTQQEDDDPQTESKLGGLYLDSSSDDELDDLEDGDQLNGENSLGANVTKETTTAAVKGLLTDQGWYPRGPEILIGPALSLVKFLKPRRNDGASAESSPLSGDGSQALSESAVAICAAPTRIAIPVFTKDSKFVAGRNLIQRLGLPRAVSPLSALLRSAAPSLIAPMPWFVAQPPGVILAPNHPLHVLAVAHAKRFMSRQASPTVANSTGKYLTRSEQIDLVNWVTRGPRVRNTLSRKQVSRLSRDDMRGSDVDSFTRRDIEVEEDSTDEEADTILAKTQIEKEKLAHYNYRADDDLAGLTKDPNFPSEASKRAAFERIWKDVQLNDFEWMTAEDMARLKAFFWAHDDVLRQCFTMLVARYRASLYASFTQAVRVASTRDAYLEAASGAQALLRLSAVAQSNSGKSDLPLPGGKAARDRISTQVSIPVDLDAVRASISQASAFVPSYPRPTRATARTSDSLFHMATLPEPAVQVVMHEDKVGDPAHRSSKDANIAKVVSSLSPALTILAGIDPGRRMQPPRRWVRSPGLALLFAKSFLSAWSGKELALCTTPASSGTMPNLTSLSVSTGRILSRQIVWAGASLTAAELAELDLILQCTQELGSIAPLPLLVGEAGSEYETAVEQARSLHQATCEFHAAINVRQDAQLGDLSELSEPELHFLRTIALYGSDPLINSKVNELLASLLSALPHNDAARLNELKGLPASGLGGANTIPKPGLRPTGNPGRSGSGTVKVPLAQQRSSSPRAQSKGSTTKSPSPSVTANTLSSSEPLGPAQSIAQQTALTLPYLSAAASAVLAVLRVKQFATVNEDSQSESLSAMASPPVTASPSSTASAQAQSAWLASATRILPITDTFAAVLGSREQASQVRDETSAGSQETRLDADRSPSGSALSLPPALNALYDASRFEIAVSLMLESLPTSLRPASRTSSNSDLRWLVKELESWACATLRGSKVSPAAWLVNARTRLSVSTKPPLNLELPSKDKDVSMSQSSPSQPNVAEGASIPTEHLRGAQGVSDASRLVTSLVAPFFSGPQKVPYLASESDTTSRGGRHDYSADQIDGLPFAYLVTECNLQLPPADSLTLSLLRALRCAQSASSQTQVREGGHGSISTAQLSSTAIAHLVSHAAQPEAQQTVGVNDEYCSYSDLLTAVRPVRKSTSGALYSFVDTLASDRDSSRNGERSSSEDASERHVYAKQGCSAAEQAWRLMGRSLLQCMMYETVRASESKLDRHQRSSLVSAEQHQVSSAEMHSPTPSMAVIPVPQTSGSRPQLSVETSGVEPPKRHADLVHVASSQEGDFRAGTLPWLSPKSFRAISVLDLARGLGEDDDEEDDVSITLETRALAPQHLVVEESPIAPGIEPVASGLTAGQAVFNSLAFLHGMYGELSTVPPASPVPVHACDSVFLTRSPYPEQENEHFLRIPTRPGVTIGQSCPINISSREISDDPGTMYDDHAVLGTRFDMNPTNTLAEHQPDQYWHPNDQAPYLSHTILGSEADQLVVLPNLPFDGEHRNEEALDSAEPLSGHSAEVAQEMNSKLLRTVRSASNLHRLGQRPLQAQQRSHAIAHHRRHPHRSSSFSRASRSTAAYDEYESGSHSDIEDYIPDAGKPVKGVENAHDLERHVSAGCQDPGIVESKAHSFTPSAMKLLCTLLRRRHDAWSSVSMREATSGSDNKPAEKSNDVEFAHQLPSWIFGPLGSYDSVQGKYCEGAGPRRMIRKVLERLASSRRYVRRYRHRFSPTPDSVSTTPSLSQLSSIQTHSTPNSSVSQTYSQSTPMTTLKPRVPPLSIRTSETGSLIPVIEVEVPTEPLGTEQDGGSSVLPHDKVENLSPLPESDIETSGLSEADLTIPSDDECIGALLRDAPAESLSLPKFYQVLIRLACFRFPPKPLIEDDVVRTGSVSEQSEATPQTDPWKQVPLTPVESVHRFLDAYIYPVCTILPQTVEQRSMNLSPFGYSEMFNVRGAEHERVAQRQKRLNAIVTKIAETIAVAPAISCEHSFAVATLSAALYSRGKRVNKMAVHLRTGRVGTTTAPSTPIQTQHKKPYASIIEPIVPALDPWSTQVPRPRPPTQLAIRSLLQSPAVKAVFNYYSPALDSLFKSIASASRIDGASSMDQPLLSSSTSSSRAVGAHRFPLGPSRISFSAILIANALTQPPSKTLNQCSRLDPRSDLGISLHNPLAAIPPTPFRLPKSLLQSLRWYNCKCRALHDRQKAQINPEQLFASADYCRLENESTPHSRVNAHTSFDFEAPNTTVVLGDIDRSQLRQQVLALSDVSGESSSKMGSGSNEMKSGDGQPSSSSNSRSSQIQVSRPMVPTPRAALGLAETRPTDRKQKHRMVHDNSLPNAIINSDIGELEVADSSSANNSPRFTAISDRLESSTTRSWHSARISLVSLPQPQAERAGYPSSTLPAFVESPRMTRGAAPWRAPDNVDSQKIALKSAVSGQPTITQLPFSSKERPTRAARAFARALQIASIPAVPLAAVHPFLAHTPILDAVSFQVAPSLPLGELMSHLATHPHSPLAACFPELWPNPGALEGLSLYFASRMAAGTFGSTQHSVYPGSEATRQASVKGVIATAPESVSRAVTPESVTKATTTSPSLRESELVDDRNATPKSIGSSTHFSNSLASGSILDPELALLPSNHTLPTKVALDTFTRVSAIQMLKLYLWLGGDHVPEFGESDDLSQSAHATSNQMAEGATLHATSVAAAMGASPRVKYDAAHEEYIAKLQELAVIQAETQLRLAKLNCMVNPSEALISVKGTTIAVDLTLVASDATTSVEPKTQNTPDPSLGVEEDQLVKRLSMAVDQAASAYFKLVAAKLAGISDPAATVQLIKPKIASTTTSKSATSNKSGVLARIQDTLQMHTTKPTPYASAASSQTSEAFKSLLVKAKTGKPGALTALFNALGTSWVDGLMFASQSHQWASEPRKPRICGPLDVTHEHVVECAARRVLSLFAASLQSAGVACLPLILNTPFLASMRAQLGLTDGLVREFAQFSPASQHSLQQGLKNLDYALQLSFASALSILFGQLKDCATSGSSSNVRTGGSKLQSRIHSRTKPRTRRAQRDNRYYEFIFGDAALKTLTAAVMADEALLVLLRASMNIYQTALSQAKLSEPSFLDIIHRHSEDRTAWSEMNVKQWLARQLASVATVPVSLLLPPPGTFANYLDDGPQKSSFTRADVLTPPSLANLSRNAVRDLVRHHAPRKYHTVVAEYFSQIFNAWSKRAVQGQSAVSSRITPVADTVDPELDEEVAATYGPAAKSAARLIVHRVDRFTTGVKDAQKQIAKELGAPNPREPTSTAIAVNQAVVNEMSPESAAAGVALGSIISQVDSSRVGPSQGQVNGFVTSSMTTAAITTAATALNAHTADATSGASVLNKILNPQAIEAPSGMAPKVTSLDVQPNENGDEYAAFPAIMMSLTLFQLVDFAKQPLDKARTESTFARLTPSEVSELFHLTQVGRLEADDTLQPRNSSQMSTPNGSKRALRVSDGEICPTDFGAVFSTPVDTSRQNRPSLYFNSDVAFERLQDDGLVVENETSCSYSTFSRALVENSMPTADAAVTTGSYFQCPYSFCRGSFTEARGMAGSSNHSTQNSTSTYGLTPSEADVFNRSLIVPETPPVDFSRFAGLSVYFNLMQMQSLSQKSNPFKFDLPQSFFLSAAEVCSLKRVFHMAPPSFDRLSLARIIGPSTVPRTQDDVAMTVSTGPMVLHLFGPPTQPSSLSKEGPHSMVAAKPSPKQTLTSGTAESASLAKVTGSNFEGSMNLPSDEVTAVVCDHAAKALGLGMLGDTAPDLTPTPAAALALLETLEESQVVGESANSGATASGATKRGGSDSRPEKSSTSSTTSSSSGARLQSQYLSPEEAPHLYLTRGAFFEFLARIANALFECPEVVENELSLIIARVEEAQIQTLQAEFAEHRAEARKEAGVTNRRFRSQVKRKVNDTLSRMAGQRQADASDDTRPTREPMLDLMMKLERRLLEQSEASWSTAGVISYPPPYFQLQSPLEFAASGAILAAKLLKLFAVLFPHIPIPPQLRALQGLHPSEDVENEWYTFL